MTWRRTGAVVAALLAAGAVAAPLAYADPVMSPGELQFTRDLLQPMMAHPPMSTGALIILGHKACTDIGTGVSPDTERDRLQSNLLDQEVMTSTAEVGTLVHYALQDLCPTVPNSTGI